MIFRLRGRRCLILQVLAQHHDSSTTPLEDNSLTLSDFIEDLKPVPARFRSCHPFHTYNVQLRSRRVKDLRIWLVVPLDVIVVSSSRAIGRG